MAQDKELKFLISADAKRAKAEINNTAKAASDAAKSVNKDAQSQSKSIDKVGISAKQAAAAMRQVPAQFTDIVVSLQAGQPPMQVLLQQGGQLKDLFGGVGNAVRALAGYIKTLITPTTLLAGAAIGLAVAFVSGANQSDRLRQNIIASGNAAGTSVGQLEGLVQQIGSLVGSYGNAREAAEALTGSGQIAAQNLEAAMRGVATGVKLTGRDVQDLTQDFVDIGKDPVKAVATLNNKYHFLTLAVYDQIKSLQDQGRTQDAVTLATNTYADAISKRSKEMVGNLGLVALSWHNIKSAASSAIDAINSIGRVKTDPTIAAADKEIAAQRDNLAKLLAPKIGGGTEGTAAQIAEQRKLLLVLQNAKSENLARNIRQANEIAANDAKIKARDTLKTFIESNAVGVDALNVEIKKLEQQRNSLVNIYGKGSQEALQAEKTTQAKIAQLREQFAKQGKTKVKGLVNPLRQSLEIGKDDLSAIKQSINEANKVALDQFAFAKSAYDEAYKNNVLSLQQYYDERLTITNQAADQELQSQQRLMDALTRTRAQVQAAPARTQQDLESKRNRLADIDKQIQATNLNILNIDRERGQSVAKIAIDREREVIALQKTLQDIALQNAEDTGTATLEQKAEAIRAKYADLIARLGDDAQGKLLIEQRINIEINQASLQKTEAEFNAALQRMRAAEESIHIQQSAGLLTEQQAREQIVILHQQSAQELERLLPLLEQAANAIGPDAVAKVQEWRNAIAQTKVSVNEVAVRLEGAFKNSVTNFFSDITDGAHSASEAIGNFAANFIKAIADIAAQRAATAIFDGVFGGQNGGAGGGDLISKIASFFFHSGGVVGQGGVKRDIPSVVFNAAPKYHAGGIAGLKSDEVPAILQKGEEVLTKNDPRHINNANTSNTPQSVNVGVYYTEREAANAVFGAANAGKLLINLANQNASALRAALKV